MKRLNQKVKLANTIYLTTDVLVCESNNHTVFRGVVFVLVLDDKTATSKVVSFTFTTPAEFNLEPLEIGFVFHNFDKSL